MTKLETLCKGAHDVRIKIGLLDTDIKNKVLNDAADSLIKYSKHILEVNAEDVLKAKEDKLSEEFIERLTLNSNRIEEMADSLRQIVKLDDPIGEVLSMKKRPNGMIIGKRRVPFGVIGIIFESMPGMVSDAFGLCFKTGNCVILDGGYSGMKTNKAIVLALKEAIIDNNIPEEALCLIESDDKEITKSFVKMDSYVDLLIPRGNSKLISTVLSNATIPVIETGVGSCHIYVDSDADFDMAIDIILNAKLKSINTSNTCEYIVVHKSVAKEFIPLLYNSLKEHSIGLECDDYAKECVSQVEDSQGNFDEALSVKVVDNIDEAIEHINKFNTDHSEVIITKDYDRAQRFLNEVDSACVYVNASTRFTDGNEFGFGAEIGISTQKLHARGPMGLEALTSYKYIIYGSGQIRK